MRIPKRKRNRVTRKPVFLSQRLRRRRKVWRGIFWLTLLGLAALPSVHWANRLLYQKQIQTAEHFLYPLPLTEFGDRVAILSPHPDDETLGCAGLIQKLLQQGIMPFLLVVTNGDGFDASIYIKLHEVQIKLEDRKTYVKMRQAETLSAMGKLGLPSSHVTFLNFSERTIANDWLWEGDDKFVKELADRLEQIQPTTVILPSRYDDHPVHAVVCSLGWAALLKIIAEGKLAQMPRVFEFLIHYGEFPRPQGFNPSLELLPPSNLLLTARWYYLPLPEEVRQRKWEALKQYRTQQLPLTWRFLKSFVRANELFSEPFPLLVQPDRAMEPRSLLAGLDITQVGFDRPQQFFHHTSQPQVKARISVRLRGKGGPYFRYGVRVWQPNQNRLLTIAPAPGNERVLEANLSVNFQEPTLIVAFTGYGKHILDMAPLVLTEGAEHGKP
ncbi:MAG: PIG-L deacetylase family protein [Candidatus Fervidibacter sp.]|uniref:PIG-L deacetylase family protein n=1 Tax=Candidatus Fervidibacter sp. TaxID=3100871 RepID=UPI00404939DE